MELLLLLLPLLRPEPESLLAGALFELAKKANATGDLPELEQPGRNVFLGEQYVNNPTLSDVTFLVQVRFYLTLVALQGQCRCLHRSRLSCWHTVSCCDCQAHAVSWARLNGSKAIASSELACLPALQDRKFYAHRIALLASSECFRAMFDGHYKEKQASVIPIPNIRFAVFERMMRCIYTGARAAPPAPWL